MSVDLLLRNGIVILQGKEAIRSIAIKTGKIEGLYERGLEPQSEIVIDCEGKYVLPGAIDIHVHLRDLKQSVKEDYSSGTKAAAVGGVTTVVDMPNSQPPTISREVLDEKIESARRKRYVNVGFYSGLPKDLSTVTETIAKDIVGLKAYPHSPLVEGVRYDEDRIRSSLKLAKALKVPLLFHPDATHPKTKTNSVSDFFEIHSCESEVVSISKFIEAHRQIGGRLHVCHVSCAAAVRLIINNRAEERLTAEVTPHHLFLSGENFGNEDGLAKVLPPLRSPYDTQVLKDALCKCGIDIVASDHAPHTSEEKKAPFLSASSGIPGLETTLPLILTEVFEGRIPWVEYLRMCSSGPANILGLVGKGVLSKGFDADIVVISKESWTIKGDKFHSKAKYTPFEGWEVKARPMMTIVGGNIVQTEGRFMVGPGHVGTVPVRALIQPRNT
ncbi:MAG: dihydroorotase family protein [Candidatus Thorarchaeota archaeon]